MMRLRDKLQAQLSEYDLDIRVVTVARFLSFNLYLIEVKISDDLTMVYTYDMLDNGASGIKETALIEIRQALGESIEMPSVKTGFDDIITYESHFG